jgi:hypothetical protein
MIVCATPRSGKCNKTVAKCIWQGWASQNSRKEPLSVHKHVITMVFVPTPMTFPSMLTSEDSHILFDSFKISMKMARSHTISLSGIQSISLKSNTTIARLCPSWTISAVLSSSLPISPQQIYNLSISPSQIPFMSRP